MDKRELADFLRSRRERIRPADVGLPAGPRRRTPGLRREEVAQLAFISAEYYTRLEQARGPNPSREVVGGLAIALRLSDAECDHLHDLAGVPRIQPGVPRDVRNSVRLLMDRLPNSVAFVLSADFEVLAWNHLTTAVMGDLSALPPRSRNLARWRFLSTQAEDQPPYEVADAAEFARSAVADLRRAHARYPDDPALTALIADLLAGSHEFAALWATGDVRAGSTAARKTFQHRLVGPITVNCDGLDITDRDQRVIIYTADPGSPSEEALRLLGVIGTQTMEATA